MNGPRPVRPLPPRTCHDLDINSKHSQITTTGTPIQALESISLDTHYLLTLTTSDSLKDWRTISSILFEGENVIPVWSVFGSSTVSRKGEGRVLSSKHWLWKYIIQNKNHFGKKMGVEFLEWSKSIQTSKDNGKKWGRRVGENVKGEVRKEKRGKWRGTYEEEREKVSEEGGRRGRNKVRGEEKSWSWNRKN